MSLNIRRAAPHLKYPCSVLAVFAFLTAILAYPLASRAWDTIANYGDPLLNAWILAWDAHALITNPLHLFDANIFHPYPNTLAYSEHLLGIAIPAAPLNWATGNAIFVHNLAVLGSFVLAGLGAYLLGSDLTRSRFAGLAAGLAFAYAGYRFSEVSQLQNVTAQWLPFTFLYLARFFRAPTWRNAFLFGLFCILQILSNTYYAFYTAIAVGLYLVFGLWRWLRTRSSPAFSAAWPRLAIALLVIAVVFVAAFLPYLSARSAVGERSLKDQDGANLQDYVSVPETGLLGQLLPAMRRDLGDGKSYFPGFVTLALAALGVGVWLRRDSRSGWGDMAFYLCLALVGFVLSLGPSLQTVPRGDSIFSPMPYTLLYNWVPGFSGMRVPARIALLVIFAITILSAYGAAILARGRHRLLFFMVPLLLLVEHFTIVAPGLPIEVGAAVPPVYRWLSELPPKDVVLELPATTSPWFWEDPGSMERLAKQQYFSTYHWHPTIMGYSGYYPPLFDRNIEYLLNFPSTAGLSYLRGLGVRHVILHHEQFDAVAWDELNRRLPLFPDQIVPAAVFGDDTVYTLPGGGGDRRPPILSLTAPSVASPGKGGIAYLEIANLNNGAYAYLAQEKLIATYEWTVPGAASVKGSVEGYLPIIDPEDRSLVPIPLPLPLQVHLPAELRVDLQAHGQKMTAVATVRAADPAEGGIVVPAGGRAHRLLRADLNFGNGLRLLDVALDSSSYRAGDSIALTLYWQKLVSEPADHFVVFFRLEKEPGKEVLSSDIDLDTPASWQAGETTTMQHLERLPLDLPAGEYRLALGVYDTRTQQFVPVIGDDGSPRWEPFRTTITVR